MIIRLFVIYHRVQAKFALWIRIQEKCCQRRAAGWRPSGGKRSGGRFTPRSVAARNSILGGGIFFLFFFNRMRGSYCMSLVIARPLHPWLVGEVAAERATRAPCTAADEWPCVILWNCYLRDGWHGEGWRRWGARCDWAGGLGGGGP